MKIAIFTATRAEYGLLRWIAKGLTEITEVYFIVGGTHLSPEDGYTINEIKNDNFENIIEIPFLSSSRTALALTSSIGNGIIQFSQIINSIKPDFVIVLGDRYEIFIPVIASLMSNIPIIHLCGGERTEGSIDEQVRHSITKIAHIHMPSTDTYAENISKMGEEDWRIHIVGAPGLENIKRMNLYEPKEIFELTGVDINEPTIICTYHPVTLEEKRIDWQLNNLFDALSNFDIQIIFTRPNAEVDSDIVVEKIKEFITKSKKVYFFNSLGTKLYLSFLKYVKAIIGNSSSGIIEAPSFGIPTVNIGNRQEGRLKPESIIQVDYSTEEIIKGINKALFNREFLNQIKDFKNPYGDGNTSNYVVQAFKEIIKLPKEKLLKKKLSFEVNKGEWHRYF